MSKKFLRKSDMKRHRVLMHTQNKTKYIKHHKVEGTYKCKICDKSYTHSHNLKVHMIKTHGK